MEQRRPGSAWLIAGGIAFVLAMPCLVAGLVLASLALVYLSVALTVLCMPLLIVGVVRLLSTPGDPAT